MTTTTDPNRFILRGLAAIDYADQHGLDLLKSADPTEGPRSGLTVAEAREVAREDANLIWLDTAVAHGRNDATEWFNDSVGYDGLAVGDIAADLDAMRSGRSEMPSCALINAVGTSWIGRQILAGEEDPSRGERDEAWGELGEDWISSYDQEYLATLAALVGRAREEAS